MKNIFIALSLFVFSFSSFAEDFVCKTLNHLDNAKGTTPTEVIPGTYSFDYSRSTDILTKIDGKSDDFSITTYALGKDEKDLTIRMGYKGKYAYWFGFNGRTIDSVIVAKYKDNVTLDSFKGSVASRAVDVKMYTNCSY